MWRWLVLLSVCSALAAMLVIVLGEPVWIAALIMLFGVFVGLSVGLTEPDSNEPPHK